MNGIGTLQENSLHAALKNWYAQPGDQLEIMVDGYVIDLVRGAGYSELKLVTRPFQTPQKR